MNTAALVQDFVNLMIIMDPPGLVPLFIGLTLGMNKADRQQTALLGSIVAFGIIAVFLLCGTALLHILGVTLDAFRVAGGILLFTLAFGMIFEKAPEREAKGADVAVSRDRIRNIAVFPLGMPLITGPGVLSASLPMASNNPGVIGMAANLAVAAIVVGCCYVCMLLASPIERLLGEAGRSIITKIFGILLAAMAAQFVIGGIANSFGLGPH